MWWIIFVIVLFCLLIGVASGCGDNEDDIDVGQ
jgi:hypothetical protein